MTNTLISQRLTLSTLALAVFASLSAQAAPPDAGQTSRELELQPGLILPKAAEPLHIKGEGAPASAADNARRISVKALHITGNSVISTSELEALVADLSTGERSFAELNTGASRITALYRERGYAVARAYLPAQDIQDGIVEIRILEGKLDQRRIDNQSRLSDDRANGYLGTVQSGEVLQAKEVDRALLLLNDTPGVGGARASLQPGASVGTSDLVVELAPGVPLTANVELDNYGNRYTGENRLGAALAFNSPLHLGDQFTVRALTSDADLTYARLAYQVPVGSSGLKLGAAYSDTHYGLGKEFKTLQAHGSANSSSLYASYPFIRSQFSNITGTLSWEDKRLKDLTDTPITNSSKQVQLVNVGLVGNHQDALGGGGVTSADLAFITGQLSMDATSLATDATTADSNGQFARFTYTLNRLQRVTDSNTLSVALSGQRASKNLNSSEKFALGGAYGVRAYPQGEGIGDEGWLAKVELRHQFMPNLQGLVFYDAGSVDINRNPFAAGSNTRNLSGAGFGANANLLGMQISASIAWRIEGGQPTSEPATQDSNPRFWVQVSKQF
jgi:hemolysin activation/secretion protein